MRERLVATQKSDRSLNKCFVAVVSRAEHPETPFYYIDHGVLMRSWSSTQAGDEEWNIVTLLFVTKSRC